MEETAIIEIPPQQVLGITKTGTYRLIPELLMKLYEFIVEKKIALAGMPTFICHETSPCAVMEANENGTAIVEVAWPVSGLVKGSGEIRVYELQGGKMVRTLHRGPYETCESTYYALFLWIEEHHLQIAGPSVRSTQTIPGWSNLKRSSPRSWSRSGEAFFSRSSMIIGGEQVRPFLPLRSALLMEEGG